MPFLLLLGNHRLTEELAEAKEELGQLRHLKDKAKKLVHSYAKKELPGVYTDPLAIKESHPAIFERVYQGAEPIPATRKGRVLLENIRSALYCRRSNSQF